MKKEVKPYWLGFDTSVYTTSIATILENGEIDYRRNVLPVKPGERGLRQSEALFKHIRRLPEMFNELSEQYDFRNLKGIGVSVHPRPIQGSYMPVFEGGKAIAHVLGDTLDIPVIEVSHQENHIEAIVLGSKIDHDKLKNKFLAIHFSGGTSEILLARLTENGYFIQRIAGSLDLKAGQLIDRIGIRLGLQFPAGAELEKIALKATQKDIIIPSRSHYKDFHFSGQENYINNLLNKGVPAEEVAYGLFKMIGRTLNKSIRKILEDEDFNVVVFSGGVMSNSIIRDEIRRKLKPTGLELIFAPAEYSSDNAIGNAALARRVLSNAKKNSISFRTE